MYNRYWGSDRRRFERLKVNLSVAYEVCSPMHARDMVGGREVEATALDLCGGGIAILTKYNIPVWSTLMIKFLFFKTAAEGVVSFFEPVDILGEVRSVVPSPHNEYRLGIAFRGVNQTEEEQIEDFAESTRRP